MTRAWPPVPMSRTRATSPGARSCRERPGISRCPIGLCDVGGLTASRLLDSSADLHDVRNCLGHANITTTSRYVRSTPVRFVPLTGEALSALCDQLHRGSVWCVMVRFVTGLYTAIIHCG